MATKNKHELANNLDVLFQEFDEYLLSVLTNSEKTEFDGLPGKIDTLKGEISTLTASIATANAEVATYGDSRASADIITEYTDLETKLTKLKNYLVKSKRLKELKGKVSSGLTADEATEMSTLQVEVDTIKTDCVQILRDFKTLFGSTETIKNAEDHIAKLKELAPKKQNLENLITTKATKEADKATLEAKLTTYQSRTEATEPKFVTFLSTKNLPITHAADLFAVYKNPTATLTMDKADVKTRHNHPKLEFLLKYFGVPIALVGILVGIITGVVASSGLIAGASFGFLPVFSNAMMNFAVHGSIWGLIGASTAAAGILSTAGIIKLHYNRVYKNAKENLELYKNGTEIEHLPITQLMNKISKTHNTVVKLNEGKWYTKILTFLPKHFLNAVNELRVAHLAKYAIGLRREFALIDAKTDSTSVRANQIKPIYALIENIDEFVQTFGKKSTAYAMLTCDDTAPHSHKGVLEYFSIFAETKEVLDKLELETNEDTEKTKTASTRQSSRRHIERRKGIAADLANGSDRLFSKLLTRWNTEYKPLMTLGPREFTLDSITYIDSGSKAILVLADKSSITVETADIKTSVDIDTVKVGKTKTVIKYVDGTKTEIFKNIKITPEVVTTRRLLLVKLTTDATFVNTVKGWGYRTVTINALIDKLKEWLKNTNKPFSLTGKMKQLYQDSIAHLDTVLSV